MAITEQDLKIFLSQKLCEIAEVMMVYYDCCGIRGNVCKGGDPNPCCINSLFGKNPCPFWINEKCQYKNVDCCLWICETAIDSTDPKCVEGLKILEQFAALFELARKPFIGEPYGNGADKIRNEQT